MKKKSPPKGSISEAKSIINEFFSTYTYAQCADLHFDIVALCAMETASGLSVNSLQNLIDFVFKLRELLNATHTLHNASSSEWITSIENYKPEEEKVGLIKERLPDLFATFSEFKFTDREERNRELSRRYSDLIALQDTDEDAVNPDMIIAQFFYKYDLLETQQLLVKLLSTYNPKTQIGKAKVREVGMFYLDLKELLAANYLHLKKRMNANKRSSENASL